MVERGYCIYSISLNIFNLLFTLKQLPCYFISQYHLQGTTFLSFSSVSFGISFEHAVQLPFTVFLYSPFPDNYAFLSLSPSQIKNIQSADTMPVHGHSPLILLHSINTGKWSVMSSIHIPQVVLTSILLVKILSINVAVQEFTLVGLLISG